MPITPRSQYALGRLRGLIAASSPGDQLPGEKQLALDLSISRATVRDALERLWFEGVIVRRWGVGTFVAEPAPQLAASHYSNLWVDYHPVGSLPERIRAAGHRVQLAGTRSERGAPPSWALDEPGFEQSVLMISRTLLIDDVPGLVMRDIVPSRISGVDVEPEVLFHPHTDFQTFLRGYGVRIVKHEARMLAAVLDADAAEQLRLAEGAPVLTARQRSISEAGEVIALSELIYRDDVFGNTLVRTVPE